MGSVVHVQHGDGSHSIGVEIDGVYVPFAGVTGARVQHLQDRAHDLGKRLENENDQAAKDAHDQLPIRASSGKPSGGDTAAAPEPTVGDGGEPDTSPHHSDQV